MAPARAGQTSSTSKLSTSLDTNGWDGSSETRLAWHNGLERKVNAANGNYRNLYMRGHMVDKRTVCTPSIEHSYQIAIGN